MATYRIWTFGRSLLSLRGLRIANYYTKSKQKKGGSGQAWLLLAGITTSLGMSAVCILGSPDDVIEGLGVEEHVKYADEYVAKAYVLRAFDKVVAFKKSFSEPSSEKLLPDLLPAPYQRPYTLILELNDLIIHTEFGRDVGWKYQKRPGVDALLVSLFDLYEIVIFTNESAMTGNSIIAALDPNQLVTYRLFRDSTKYIDGEHVKDLSALNRSLSHVIVVDTSKSAVRYHPENAIILDKWTGDINDRTLWALIPFLQTIATNGVDDTRPVLDYYKQHGEGNILETFKSYQELIRAEEEDLDRQRVASRSRYTGGIGKISPYFGGSTPSLVSSSKRSVTGQQSVAETVADKGTPPLSLWSKWIGWK